MIKQPTRRGNDVARASSHFSQGQKTECGKAALCPKRTSRGHSSNSEHGPLLRPRPKPLQPIAADLREPRLSTLLPVGAAPISSPPGDSGFAIADPKTYMQRMSRKPLNSPRRQPACRRAFYTELNQARRDHGQVAHPQRERFAGELRLSDVQGAVQRMKKRRRCRESSES